MSETIEQARENIGMDFVDVSDADTPDQLSGKVRQCINYGTVQADFNAGGIAGVISPENDMNGIESILFTGDDSMNVENEFRAVIVSCDNKADVIIKKQNAGGIVGWMTMGLVKDCVNIGTVDAENADYLGGIAGSANGYIRSCYSSCSLFGDSNVGGIAGSGTVVTDCRSMVTLEGSEKTGGILGLAEEPIIEQIKSADATEVENPEEEDTDPPVSGNYYVTLGGDMGGIDGISYSGRAESLALDAFMALEDIPMEFGTVVVRFICEDEVTHSISLVPGGKLKSGQLPKVPEKDGFTAVWAGLESANLDHISTDLTFYAEYTAKNPTIQSAEQRENGIPVLLAQGLFSGEQFVSLEPIEDHSTLSQGEDWAESWAFSFPNGGEVTKLRVSLPPGCGDSTVRLTVLDSNGQWQAREFTVEGSYLVFAHQDSDRALCLINSPNITLTVLLSAGAVLAAVLVIILLRKLRDKPRNSKI